MFYVFSLIFGMVIFYSFEFIIASLVFWFRNFSYAGWLSGELIKYSRRPDAIYKNWFKNILKNHEKVTKEYNAEVDKAAADALEQVFKDPKDYFKGINL